MEYSPQNIIRIFLPKAQNIPVIVAVVVDCGVAVAATWLYMVLAYVIALDALIMELQEL